MTAGMITLLSFITYFLGTMVTARALHVVNTKAMLRWKNEAPNKECALYRHAEYGGSGYYHRTRKEVDLYDFTKNSKKLIGKELLPRGLAFFWPFFAPVWAINRFCFPEVKIGDQAKIKDLERKALDKELRNL
jgi:hypothetical protein